MKIESYSYPQSSFLSVEKDLTIITNHLLKNDRLKKLLYYTTKDCLDKPDLTDEETYSLFGNQVKIIPKLKVDGSVLNYIIITFDNFTENRNNPEFRDNVVSFDIVCHFDQWQLKDFQLRPYRIAAEIDSMLNKQRLTGIGKLEFIGLNEILLTDEYAGLCLMYRTYHGEEDKKFFNDPVEDEQFIQEFKEMQDEAMSP